MKLTVATTERDDVTIVTVSGEVDVYTAPQLRSALEERIAAGHTAIIVDLQGVGFLDSTGLGVLVGRLKAVKKVDGWLRVVCTNERILRLFGITGLDRVLPIHESVDAALAAGPDDFLEPDVPA
ncbi:putative anti-sigma factor antagonist [Janibacter sp. HTCC2649]|uniref:STAS domain-containing protein n=1 Tax=Janibacter sp. HTCC2649 TaxID=313589 RepID=UPI0000670B67|nr:STAS domain-containing protein [Janibacter sp. HTCC2649]EAQ00443.1 putative anti-sigma factor antagonist [Janibacter sp. HTCC2649]